MRWRPVWHHGCKGMNVFTAGFKGSVPLKPECPMFKGSVPLKLATGPRHPPAPSFAGEG